MVERNNLCYWVVHPVEGVTQVLRRPSPDIRITRELSALSICDPT